MLIKDLKNNVALNPKFLAVIPQTCPEANCGYPLSISEALTGLHCSNPRCPSKITQRLVAMAQDLGIKDMGESTAKAFVARYKAWSPLFMFAYKFDEDGAWGNKSEATCRKLEKAFTDKHTFTLAEYVKVANLPYIQGSATTLFGEFDKLDDAYKPIEEGGVAYIQKKLGIKDDTVSVRATNIYQTLMTAKYELTTFVDYVNIKEINKGTVVSIKNVDTSQEDFELEGDTILSIKACCSTSVGAGFATKADFYATIHNLYPMFNIEFTGSVTKNTDYLIWAGADTNSNAPVTNKVQKARDLQKNGSKIKIMSALQFMGELGRLKGDKQ